MARPITRKPIAVAKTSAGIVEVVKIEQKAADIMITHVLNNAWHTTVLRHDRYTGEGYFHANGMKIYIADLRKVTCLN